MAQTVRSLPASLRFISGLAGLAAASVASYAPNAQACSGVAAGDDFSVLAEIPENGHLRGTYTCKIGHTCSFPQALEVLNSAGQPVAGELTVWAHPDATSAIYTFRPAQPWTLGETYTVTDLATAPLAQPASTFTVIPAVTLDPERIAAQLGVSEVRTALNEVCCDEVIGSCGEPHCIALESQIELALYMQVTLPEGHGSQWLSRLHAVDLGDESTTSAVRETLSPWGFPLLHVVEQRHEYCVQVEFLSLVDGTTVLREPQCVEHGTAATLGRVIEAPTPDSAAECESPRPGIEEAWCAGMAERCERGWPEDACARHDEHCPVASTDTEADSDAGGCALVQAARPASSVRCGWLALLAAAVARRWRRARAAANSRR